MMNPEVLQVVHEKDPWIEDPDGTWHGIEEQVPEIADKKSRRKSWHAIKFERKRRKGVVEPGSPPEARQKRPSWWNIFGGQQWPRYGRGNRSRRRRFRYVTAPSGISTDFGVLGSAESPSNESGSFYLCLRDNFAKTSFN
jgi:hypothetical protein